MEVVSIVVLSILFQLVATFWALKLIPITGRGKAWMILSTALFFMAIRRCITLFHLTANDASFQPGMFSEMFSLLTSILMMFGIISISPLFSSIKASTEALEESKERYRQLIETMNDGFEMQDEHGVITYANARFCNILGCSRNEVVGSALSSFLDEDNKKVWKEQLQRGQQGESEPYEMGWTRKDNTKVSTIVSPKPLFDAGGSFKGSFAVITDISQQKKAEERLRESEERLRALINAMPDIVCFKDAEGRWLEVNEAGMRLFQLEGVDYRGKRGNELAKLSCFYREAFITCRDTDEKAWERMKLSRGEEIIPQPGNTTKVYDVTKVPLFHPDGERKGLVVLGRDVTEGKLAEKALKKKSEEQAMLLDNIETQIWYLKDAETYGAVNEAHALFMGMEKNCLQQRKIGDMVRDEEAASAYISANREVFEKKERIRTEKWIENSKGERRLLSITKTPKLDENGSVEYVICTAQDVTEQKEAEEQIRTSLKEKEVLLKEIHHRVKNNLQIVSSLLNLQSRYIHNRQLLDMLNDSQNRIKSIALVHEKLYQSKSLARIDFPKYIQNLVRHLFRSYGINTNTILVKIDIEDVFLGLDTVISCGLIINELVSNSLKHAFPGDTEGKIDIALHGCDENFMLAVSDNGIGLPVDMDFKNTESLGLKLVAALVEELRGTVDLDSNGGLQFKITFKESDGKRRG